MDPQLLHIIQWARSGAQGAKDPRLKLLGSLYKSSSIDPHSLKAVRTKTSIAIYGRLLYTTPDIAALKKKKLVMIRASKELSVVLEEATPTTTVILSHSRSMFTLTLEEVLMLCNLYVVFSDKRKAELFQTIIQGDK